MDGPPQHCFEAWCPRHSPPTTTRRVMMTIQGIEDGPQLALYLIAVHSVPLGSVPFARTGDTSDLKQVPARKAPWSLSFERISWTLDEAQYTFICQVLRIRVRPSALPAIPAIPSRLARRHKTCGRENLSVDRRGACCVHASAFPSCVMALPTIRLHTADYQKCFEF